MKSLLTCDLSIMTTAKLVSLFEKLSLAQAAAQEYFATAKANRHIRRRYQVLDELRHRAKDERTELLPLYDHPHPAVRVNAALGTYALDPPRARAVLEQLQSPNCPWGVDARMSLDKLRDGTSLLPSDPDYRQNVSAKPR